MNQQEILQDLWWDIRKYKSGHMDLEELLMKAYELCGENNYQIGFDAGYIEGLYDER